LKVPSVCESNITDSDASDTRSITSTHNNQVPDIPQSATHSATPEARPRQSYINKGKQPAYSSVLAGIDNFTVNRDIHEYQETIATSPMPTAFNVQSGEHFNHKRAHRISQSSALYLAGVPHQPLGDIKRTLSQKPISLQARHIRNASWIDGRILELLIDSNHAQSMRNRITKYSSYLVRKTFDPLSPESFHWEGNIAHEAQESLLKNKLAARLGASIASTQHESTRNHIMLWAKQRGIEAQVVKQVVKEGIHLSSESANVTKACSNTMADTDSDSVFTTAEMPVTVGVKRFSILKRPYSSMDNIHELVNFYISILLFNILLINKFPQIKFTIRT